MSFSATKLSGKLVANLSKKSTLTIIYHGTVDQISLSQSSSVSISQYIFASNYAKPVVIKQPAKHIKSNILIITQIYLQNKNVLTELLEPVLCALWKLLQAPNVLAIFNQVLYQKESLANFTHFQKDSEKNPWQTEHQMLDLFWGLPAVKLLAGFDFLQLICNDYCIETEILEISVLLQTQSFLDLHKRFFWSANNKKLPAYIDYVPDSFYEQKSHSKNILCDYIYRERKYKLLKEAMYCFANMMLSTEISKVHNVSYTGLRQKKSKLDGSMEQDMQGVLKLIWGNALHLQYYSGRYYFYCLFDGFKNSTSIIESRVWIKPIDTNVWIVVVSIWLSCSLVTSCFKRKQLFLTGLSDSIIFHFLLFTRASVNSCKISKLYILVAFAGILFWSHYETEMTSHITVRDTLEPFQTVAELFSSGFRFGARDCAKLEFGQTCIKNLTLKDEDWVYRKLAWKEKERWVQWHLPLIRSQYDSLFGTEIKCFHALEPVEQQPFWFLVFTNNRYWVLKTMKRVTEAGLMEAWNDWGMFVVKNFKRHVFLKIEEVVGADVIDMPRLLSVVTLCMGLLVFGFCIMIIECLRQMMDQYVYQCCYRQS